MDFLSSPPTISEIDLLMRSKPTRPPPAPPTATRSSFGSSLSSMESLPLSDVNTVNPARSTSSSSSSSSLSSSSSSSSFTSRLEASSKNLNDSDRSAHAVLVSVLGVVCGTSTLASVLGPDSEYEYDVSEESIPSKKRSSGKNRDADAAKRAARKERKEMRKFEGMR